MATRALEYPPEGSSGTHCEACGAAGRRSVPKRMTQDLSIYLPVTKVSYAFIEHAALSRGILFAEAGSYFDTVSTGGIAGPEFKTYRIIMYVGGTFLKSRPGENPPSGGKPFR